VGLLQLLPSTAQELGGAGITATRLMEPQLNAQLGGRYLSQMLRETNGNTYLAVASYNAGAGAAGSWASPLLNQIPELWVEAIPYPETRIYVKSVLGNRWTYQLLQAMPNH
jgi:soluble lytic murein transglycosylase